MFESAIHDDELLPVCKQIDMLDEVVSKDICADTEFRHEVINRIHNQLNRDFSREVITVFDYIDLSLRLNRHSAALTQAH